MVLTKILALLSCLCSPTQILVDLALEASDRRLPCASSDRRKREHLAFPIDYLKDAAMLAIDTGLRVGELAALRWEDVHLEPVGGAKFG